MSRGETNSRGKAMNKAIHDIKNTGLKERYIAYKIKVLTRKI